MEWKAVTAYFYNEGLLPNQHVEISSFDELERIILDCVLSLEITSKPKKIVHFDAECIESWTHMRNYLKFFPYKRKTRERTKSISIC
jgi:hypothetical protein